MILASHAFFAKHSSAMTNPAVLTDILKQTAHQLGFDLVGACPAVTPPRLEQFRQWLANGYAGQMHYLADRADAYQHPRHVLDGVQSLLMLGMPYRTVEPNQPGAGQGRVSRYCWGQDYHDLIHERLKQLIDVHRGLTPQANLRGVVDTTPLLEREFAQLAGLGWIGKNTLLLNRRLGSWFFLAALLTSEELAYDEPFEGGYCGTCRACLDACPTGALVDAYRLNAQRCISYLTVELRESIPQAFRDAQGDWLFGCDICQEVCPWNRHAPSIEESAFQPLSGGNPMDLADLFFLDDDAFRQRFRKTPLWRPRRRGLLRNAAIVLGNRPTESAFAALAHGLNDSEPLVRASCAWALGHYSSPAARASLQGRLAAESDEEVRAEITAAFYGSQ
jgi:epoxyqueuosine reductase